MSREYDGFLACKQPKKSRESFSDGVRLRVRGKVGHGLLDSFMTSSFRSVSVAVLSVSEEVRWVFLLLSSLDFANCLLSSALPSMILRDGRGGQSRPARLHCPQTGQVSSHYRSLVSVISLTNFKNVCVP